MNDFVSIDFLEHTEWFLFVSIFFFHNNFLLFFSSCWLLFSVLFIADSDVRHNRALITSLCNVIQLFFFYMYSARVILYIHFSLCSDIKILTHSVRCLFLLCLFECSIRSYLYTQYILYIYTTTTKIHTIFMYNAKIIF